ncbi:MAG TPA: DUF308 domain-containing protein [Solirubrobacterales bacterium]|jgi:uncharacterized membrane protein HdeD (DUF308 family)|nr:DUF308 domain-containing protein [Solirubrobacterales bacterium]
MATAATPLEQVASKWWVPMLIGLLSVAAGILALAYQDITLLALGLILGIYILVFATFALVSAFEPGASTSHVVLRMIVGIVGILAGIMLIVRGVFEIALGWELHRLRAT